MPASRDEILSRLKAAADELASLWGDRVVAVGLFGSYARGEADERSDVDVLVVVKGWEDERRRFRIYDVLHRHLLRDVTLIDIDYDVVEELLSGRRRLTYSMLNILYDCVVVYDREGILSRLVDEVRRLVRELGLRRYKVGKAYGWIRADGKPLLWVVLGEGGSPR